jgi:hypothetical protein
MRIGYICLDIFDEFRIVTCNRATLLGRQKSNGFDPKFLPHRGMVRDELAKNNFVLRVLWVLFEPLYELISKCLGFLRIGPATGGCAERKEHLFDKEFIKHVLSRCIGKGATPGVEGPVFIDIIVVVRLAIADGV